MYGLCNVIYVTLCNSNFASHDDPTIYADHISQHFCIYIVHNIWHIHDKVRDFRLVGVCFIIFSVYTCVMGRTPAKRPAFSTRSIENMLFNPTCSQSGEKRKPGERRLNVEPTLYEQKDNRDTRHEWCGAWVDCGWVVYLT